MNKLKYQKEVAIQGIRGCNHHIASIECNRYADHKVLECSTFKELAENVKCGAAGIMAIENTIAGAILPNYQLILDYGLRITGEWKLRIKHSLAALPGTSLSDITEVDSHPMALLQCTDFLSTLNAKVVQHEDTAGSAKMIAEHNLKNQAAICPSLAASLYGLDILADGIETNKRNFTRFFFLDNGTGVVPDMQINKSSIVFALPHAVGSLSEVLSILSIYGMNMSMIQSVPIIGREWEYRFYVDLLFSDYDRYEKALSAIEPLTSELLILGEYEEN